MAKSISQIRMDYDNAVRQANSLRQIARELRSTANGDFQDCVADISRNWTGNNSDSYIRKCNTLKENIIKTASNLEKTADTIRRIAKNTYDAEMRAVSLAMIRKY